MTHSRRSGCLVWIAALIGLPILGLILTITVVIGLFDFFTGGRSVTLIPATAQPPFSTPIQQNAITTEYLPYASAYLHSSSNLAFVHSTLLASIMTQASKGRVYSETRVCSNHRTTNAACAVTYPGTHTVYADAGLGHINSGGWPPGPATPPWIHWFGPDAVHLFSVNDQTTATFTNYFTDILRSMATPNPVAAYCPVPPMTPYIKIALEDYAASFRLPALNAAQWADQVRSTNTADSSAPILGAWADTEVEPAQTETNARGVHAHIPTTMTVPARYVDPKTLGPVWVLIDAWGPYGAGWSQMWKPPTVIMLPKHRYVCTYYHITGRSLTPPVVVAVENGSQTVYAHYTGIVPASNTTLPVDPGGALWLAKVLVNSHTQVVARWSNGTTYTVPLVPTAQAFQPTPGGPISGPSIGGCQALAQWRPEIQQAAQLTGVSALRIAAEILNESGGVNQCNPYGACGLMQLEPGTYATYASAACQGDATNPQCNIDAGASYLAALHATQTTNSWRLTAAAYYGGPNGVATAIEPNSLQSSWSSAIAQDLAEAVPPNNVESLGTYAESFAQNVATIAQWGVLNGHSCP